MDDLRGRQLAREKQQRQAALGKRQDLADKGNLGPVIKRWINASVTPVSERLQLAGSLYLAGDYAAFCSVLDSAVFELQPHVESGSGARTGLNTIFYWLTRGKGEYAQDMVLSGLGFAISRLASQSLDWKQARLKTHKRDGVFMTGLLSSTADAIRETCLGQFITQVQGAEAMERVRRKDRSSWAQRDKMDAVAMLLYGQVMPQLMSEDRGEVVLDKVGTRSVVRVLRQTADGPIERNIRLRKPQKEDWEMLAVASRVKGEADPYAPAWMTFALTVLCAAQAEFGWFDIDRERKPQAKRAHAPAWTLHLSDHAKAAMEGDLSNWLRLGFTHDPMLVPPENGDYLSVKHKTVTGRRGPQGHVTDADESSAWKIACEVMAKTPFEVSRETLTAINNGTLWEEALRSTDGDEASLKALLGAYGREAGDQFYMPLYMDFRGRVYPRTTWVTYQGRDVQKGLLRFTDKEPGAYTFDVKTALAFHATGLWGNGLDKAPGEERRRWWEDIQRGGSFKLSDAEEPIQFANLVSNHDNWDSTLCQIDGTCNGLQHLSALFRDEEAAPYVNLTASAWTDAPADLYGRVADVVLDMMSRPMGSFECDSCGSSDGPLTIDRNWKWIGRSIGAYKIDRKLCKKPVMVLPYGGTFDAIERAVTEAVLAQNPPAERWQQCQVRLPIGGLVRDDEAWAGEQNYQAFVERPLEEHPLFHRDMKMLAAFVLEAIRRTIPRAMGAMDAFRAIAGNLGERVLEWRTGNCEDDLWVVHAYPKSSISSLRFRGFELPNSIRSLKMRVGHDEVDPKAHRTGIVANFIHSLDAAHLARTMMKFKVASPDNHDFAAIHDCYITRPSLMPILGNVARVAFEGLYMADPLAQPVRLRDLRTGKLEEFVSWYALAESFGVHFPERGTWKPEEVMRSAFFFS